MNFGNIHASSTGNFPPQGALVWMMLASVWVLLVDNWGWLLVVLSLAWLWGWYPATVKQRWWLVLACLLTTWSFVISQGLFYQVDQPSSLLEIPLLADGKLTISKEGAMHGLRQSLRWYSLLLLATGLLVRYSPDSLAAGFQRLGLPSQVAFLFALALQYLPWLASDTLSVLRIARLRGCQRWQWPTIIPSLVRSLMAANMHRANTITLAMLSKGITSFSLPESSLSATRLSVCQQVLLYSCSLLVFSVIVARTFHTMLERGFIEKPDSWQTLFAIITWLNQWL